MLTNLRGVSPLSETMSDNTFERQHALKATITKSPSLNPVFAVKPGILKNYSDKNGNDVSKSVQKGRKTFVFWTLVCLLFVLAIGNLLLTFTIIAVLRLGHGLESMEFLPEHNAIKFFGKTNLDHIYKKDGVIENTHLIVNTSGVFIRGVNSFELVEPATGERVFSTNDARISLAQPLNNLLAKQISTKRLSSPVDEDLLIRSDTSLHLQGAEGTRMESKDIHWNADQDIHLKSINGSIVLSGKEGVFIDVRYLPIAMPLNRDNRGVGQFKVCVCMPQGKLFRVAVPTGQKVTCSHVNMTGDLNPCL
ncbi:unnamed protein product [Leptidea sinapis]|uniref:Beta-sarcoglycan n=1 Tax=Leptidea sinapis TaxID=189913 RepID=A0A5E4PP16_9NEOP|nr:unnamed protein product [Leptidea sinapis]